MAKKKTLKTETQEQHKFSASGEALDVGPAVSPYMSPSCKIYFKTGQPFTVPQDLIRVSVELDKVCSDFNEIHIEDVPDEAGHVLVHYLYTGTWQTLNKRHSLYDSKVLTQFEISVHVYAAARAYGLSGLVDVAKGNISRLAKTLPALDVIVLAAGGCELLLDDDLWFLGFIKMRVEDLFEDPASLNRSVFLGCCHGASTYSKMLAKSMVQICCENSVSLKSAESRVLSPPKIPTVSEPDATASTESPQTTPDLASEPEPEVAPEAEAEPTAEVALESEVVLPEPEPEAVILEREPIPEPELECKPEPTMEAAEDLDFPILSKKSKKKGKKLKKAEIQEVICAYRAAHVVDGGWEDCSNCREYVGTLSSSYQSRKSSSLWNGI